MRKEKERESPAQYSDKALHNTKTQQRKLTSRNDLFAPHTLPADVLLDGDMGGPWVLKMSEVEAPVTTAGPDGTAVAVEKEEEDAAASFST